MSNKDDGSMVVGGPATEGSIEITVIRANGDVEELGVVSYYHKNPIKNWWVNRKIRRKRNGN